MPGLSFVLGGTEAEARARNAELNELAGEQRREWLAWQISVDPEVSNGTSRCRTGCSIRKRPPLALRGARDIVLNLARRERLTVCQLMDRIITWHRLGVGSPEQLADAIPNGFSRAQLTV
jgi:hypothetical protein